MVQVWVAFDGVIAGDWITEGCFMGNPGSSQKDLSPTEKGRKTIPSKGKSSEALAFIWFCCVCFWLLP